MLAEVRIRDLALLESVDLVFGPGLNAVSGETGEGKSLLLLAVMLLLGSRSRRGLVRTGCQEATIEGRFLLDAEARQRAREATDLVEETDTEVCLKRVVCEDGTSRAYLNGSLCPVGLLGRIGSRLVDVHGQGDHQSLRGPAEQARVLDRFGGLEQESARWAETWRAWRETGRRLEEADVLERAHRDRLDLLRFQVSALDELAPRAGEEAQLTAEAVRLARATDRGAVLGDAAGNLVEGDGSVQETCARLARQLRELDCGDDAVVERLETLRLEAADLGSECGALARGSEPDPERESRVVERLDAYRTLARRHRVDPDGLASLHALLAGELADLDQTGDPRTALERQRETLEKELGRLGPSLAAARLSAARRLEKEVRVALKELRMERARFEAAPGQAPEGQAPGAWTEVGPGAGRFLVSVNPGEDLQGLERVASGGETARIHLALRGALAGHHRIPILVFDEIDAGIGGRAGLPFGRRLGALARPHQVLVVTHLPQVAAFAARHFRVQKAVRGGRTRTTIHELAADARLLELAQMLGGDVAPDAARVQAEALMREAGA